MSSLDAYYEALDESSYRANPHTMSPWDARMQHGGPPAALLAHVIARAFPREDVRIAKIALDFLGPIPMTEVRAAARVIRPGKKIELIEASLSAGGRETVVARAWRIAIAPGLALPPHAAGNALPPALPPESARRRNTANVPIDPWPYEHSIEWRFVSGGAGTYGPVGVWTRVLLPLVAGRALAPLERLLVVVDSANGLSGVLPMDRWSFVPPSLTVALHREPEGEWTWLEAASEAGTDGIGLCEARYADENGYLGAGLQPLLVAPR